MKVKVSKINESYRSVIVAMDKDVIQDTALSVLAFEEQFDKVLKNAQKKVDTWKTKNPDAPDADKQAYFDKVMAEDVTINGKLIPLSKFITIEGNKVDFKGVTLKHLKGLVIDITK